MAAPVLLCADGSELSTEALRAGLALLAPELVPHVVVVLIEPDPSLLTGTGIAGGVMSTDAFQVAIDAADDQAKDVVSAVTGALGLDASTGIVLRGDPSFSICQHAEEVGAAAIVIGTRGRGGFRRAVLGSVSDHVIRHAPCPVIVTTAHGADHEPG